MAREFSKSEIIRQKCSICGSKNKKFTEFIYSNKMIGYSLTCCNCGHIDSFFTTKNTISGIYKCGREVCLQLSPCNNKQCEYYNKYKLKNAIDKLENILNGKQTDLPSGNCTCSKECNCDHECPNINNSCAKEEIEISDSYQLDINDYRYNSPKFH